MYINVATRAQRRVPGETHEVPKNHMHQAVIDLIAKDRHFNVLQDMNYTVNGVGPAVAETMRGLVCVCTGISPYQTESRRHPVQTKGVRDTATTRTIKSCPCSLYYPSCYFTL